MKKLNDKDKSQIKTFLQRLAIFAVAMVLIFGFVFRVTFMPSDDMKPALRFGDILLEYRIPSDRHIGQVVSYSKNGQEYVGRIAAMPGDTVDIKEETLLLNGNRTTSSDIYFSTPAYAGDVKLPLQLGEDEYFILGDYRSAASDSRRFGPVTESEITGNVITVLRRSQI